MVLLGGELEDVDVCLISVIYCDLVGLVVDGCFCEDFYYCFNGMVVSLLLLCECSDCEELLDYLLVEEVRG